MHKTLRVISIPYALPQFLPIWGDLEGWSRDPMFEKYPSISPYTYCANNPMKYVDDDGKRIVLPNLNQASRVVNNLNSIYKDKYGVDDAFYVKLVTYNVQVRTNPVTLSPTTWFKKAEYKMEQRKRYELGINYKFNWNKDIYTKALADIVENKQLVYVNIVSPEGNGVASRGRKVNLNLFGGGQIISPNHIRISEDLPDYGQTGTKGNFPTVHSLGGIILHELLFHVSDLGNQENDCTKMQYHYSIKRSNSHESGHNNTIDLNR